MKHAAAKVSPRVDSVSIVWIVVGALIAAGNLLYCLYISDSRSVLVVGFGLIVISLIVYLVTDALRRRGILTINGMIIALVVTCGLYYAAVFPPFTVPDEPYHYLASYILANDLTGAATEPDAFAIRATDLAFLQSFYDNQIIDLGDYELLFQGPGGLEGSTETAPYDFTGEWPAPWPSRLTNLPQYKFVTVFALLIGRWFGFSGYVTFYLGRVFALAYFAGLCYIALRLLPIATKIFAVIFLLPITLHLAASYSYDSPMLGYYFILIALYLRALYAVPKITNGLVAATVIVAAIAAPCKLIYTCICFVGFLVPREKFSSTWQAVIYRFGPFVAAIILALIFRMSALESHTTATVDPVRGEGHGIAPSDLLVDPLGIGAILLRTLYFYSDFYTQTIVGGSLGWLQPDIVGPWSYVIVFVILLAFSSARVAHQAGRITPAQRAVFIAIFAVVVLLALCSMLFGNTYDYEPVAMGVQGRYFLPALPLLLLACQNGAIVMKRDYTSVFITVALLINTMYPAVIFAHGLTVV